MKEISTIITEHVSRPYFHQNTHQEPWQKLPELPAGNEILDPVDAADLPHNDISGPYPSKLDYIGTQYQLLRYDAIAPIIETVQEFRRSPNLDDTQNTCIYTHVSK